jgi:pimeloyl-ACP methyl ester carboxylesterase
MAGQAYVEYQVPVERRSPFPLVIIPGGYSTAAGYRSTPDGRPGWAEHFLRQGYAVYIIEQPARGRSVYQPLVDGKAGWLTAEELESFYTAPSAAPLYPQATGHTQWPGSGRMGDATFDQSFAAKVSQITDREIREHANQEAGAALLDVIGPSILLTHSQSGTYGWLIADARPSLVRAIVAVEPGCAVGFVTPVGPPEWFEYSGVDRTWGLANVPLTWDPPVERPEELSFVLQDEPDGPGLARCWFQAEPARRLTNLRDIPVALVSSPASFHTPYDRGTAAFLRQAGVDCTYIQLAEHGIFGNGHSMMEESNSDDIAQLIADWLVDRLQGGSA